jgi:hypothetical protein
MKANTVKALRDRRSKKCMNEKWRNLHKVNSLGSAHPTATKFSNLFLIVFFFEILGCLTLASIF